MRCITTSLLALAAASLTACDNGTQVAPATPTAPQADPTIDIASTRGIDRDAPFSFAVIGDTPYGAAMRAKLPALVAEINGDPLVRFVAHLGDLKSGKNGDCTDGYFEDVANVLAGPAALGVGFDPPFVYTPGDNEWADCHVAFKNNGLHTPTERLQFIRGLFFPTPGLTLGHHPRVVLTEALDPRYRDFVENVMWLDAGVVFVTVNITGSNNDIAWWGTPLPTNAAEFPSQQTEVETRSRANAAWIDRAFLAARLVNARGLVLMSQADPWDTTEPDFIDYNQVPYTKLSGYDALVQQIGTLAAAFGKPVLLLEGDSHVFKSDNPFSAASPLHGIHAVTPVAENIVRIVVEGDQRATEYLRVTIDPHNPAGLFSWTHVPLI